MKIASIPVSIGELLDKITILQIKSQYSNSIFIKKELDDLIKISKELDVYKEEYIKDLYTVNNTLWEIEDKLRRFEKLKKFDNEFIELSRRVYITNDKRSEIKKRINEDMHSEYMEIKVY